MERISKLIKRAPVIIFIFGLLLLVAQQQNTYLLNDLSVSAMKMYFDPVLRKNAVSENLYSETCRAVWFLAHIDQLEGAPAAAKEKFKFAIKCDPSYIHLLRNVYADDKNLAQYAVDAQPEAAMSWFWLAEIEGGYQDFNFNGITDENRTRVIEMLQTGLALSPEDGLRWRLLGDVQRAVDLNASMLAYEASCLNGDPGYNGCVRAGSVAEQLGDIEKALYYYRLSTWPGVESNIERLEDR